MAVAVLAVTLLFGYPCAAHETIRVTGIGKVARETIRISGTGSATMTMRFLGDAFERSNPWIRVEVLPGIGSSGSVSAVLAGRLDIGLSARGLTDEERAKGASETRYAMTPFVFGVNRTLKMTGLTLDEVAGIYSGMRDWENKKRIRLVLRPAEDSDISTLREMSAAMGMAVDIALRRRGMITALTDHEAADAIESVPGAFGGTTLAIYLSERRGFRVLSLDGVKPSLRAMADRSYPYSKTFIMITRRNPPVPVRRFIDFVRSPAGEAILARYGQAAVRAERTDR